MTDTKKEGTMYKRWSVIGYSFAAACVFALVVLICVLLYQKSVLSYEDLELKEYGYIAHKTESVQLVHEKIHIYVIGEEKPLLIDIITEDIVDRDELTALKSGDTIYCYVTHTDQSENSYEVAEMYTENGCIFSLAERNRAHRDNTRVGIVLFSVLSALGLIVALSIYVAHKRFLKKLDRIRIEAQRRREEQTNEQGRHNDRQQQRTFSFGSERVRDKRCSYAFFYRR